MVLACRWDRTNPQSTSSFCSGSISMWWCCSRVGVAVFEAACTEMYCGSEREREARSATRLVCVAEKSRVCRLRGSSSRMAAIVCLKPRSSSRSA